MHHLGDKATSPAEGGESSPWSGGHSQSLDQRRHLSPCTFQEGLAGHCVEEVANSCCVHVPKRPREDDLRCTRAHKVQMQGCPLAGGRRNGGRQHSDHSDGPLSPPAWPGPASSILGQPGDGPGGASSGESACCGWGVLLSHVKSYETTDVPQILAPNDHLPTSPNVPGGSRYWKRSALMTGAGSTARKGRGLSSVAGLFCYRFPENKTQRRLFPRIWF